MARGGLPGLARIKMLSAKPGSRPVPHIKPSHYFQQAFTITLLNPKAIVFYMAFSRCCIIRRNTRGW